MEDHPEGTALADALAKQDLLQEENLQLKAEAGQLRAEYHQLLLNSQEDQRVLEELQGKQQLLQEREKELGSRCESLQQELAGAREAVELERYIQSCREGETEVGGSGGDVTAAGKEVFAARGETSTADLRAAETGGDS